MVSFIYFMFCIYLRTKNEPSFVVLKGRPGTGIFANDGVRSLQGLCTA